MAQLESHNNTIEKSLNNNFIEYKLLTEEYLSRAIECLCTIFGFSEPMGMTLGHSPDDYHDFLVYYTTIACEQKLGHVAIDTITGKVIGAIISEDYAKGFFATLPRPVVENKRVGRVVKVLHMLHDNFFHDNPELEKEIKSPQSFGKYVHLNFTGIFAEYRGRGIASKLTDVHFEFAKHVLGYKGAVAECTSHTSRSIKEQHQFVSKAVVKYSDYETNHLETGELYKPFESITLKNPKNDGCHLMWLEQFQ